MKSTFDRRSFLAGALSGLIAGSVFDPERLLWKPGSRLISFPRREVFYGGVGMGLERMPVGAAIQIGFGTTWGQLAIGELEKYEVIAIGDDVAALGGKVMLFASVDKPCEHYGITSLSKRSFIQEYEGCGPVPNRYRSLAIGLRSDR